MKRRLRLNKMKIHRIALILTVFVACSFSAYGQTAANAATWRVQKYDISVALPHDNSRVLAVKAILAVKNVSTAPASSLTLRLASFAEVTAARINELPVELPKNDKRVVSSTDTQTVVLRFQPVASGSTLTAAIDYKLAVKENSAVGELSATGSRFLPLSFWYPTPNSWFLPSGADAAPVKISITAPSGQTVISSGVETGGVFDQKPTGQPFFISGVWENINSNGVSVFAPKGSNAETQKRAGELAALVVEAREFVAGILGKAPDVPLRIVASRRGAGFGSGGTLIVDEAVFRRSAIDAFTVMNIAEAMAKLWLGNAVSVTGNGHGVIGEGLSRYIAIQFIEQKYGKDVADIERLRQRSAYAAVSKRDAPMSTISPLDDFYYQAVANKGAMAWRILARRVGPAEFANAIKAGMQDGNISLPELRAAFSGQKDLVDYLFDQVTDTDLQVGLPQTSGGETKVAVRNVGSADVTVDIVATLESGQKVVSPTTIRGNTYGEAAFKTNGKVVSVEIDVEKLYPQINYSNDVQPRPSVDGDPPAAVKALFDKQFDDQNQPTKQNFAKAEVLAKAYLREMPRFDDMRVLLGRSLLAQDKNVEAEKEFRAILAEKLPTARSLAWANVGLAEVASRSNQKESSLKFIEAAILSEGEYAASLAARNLRNKLGIAPTADADVKAFFTEFDKAATSNRKADIEALIAPGEVTNFSGRVSSSTQQWQSTVRRIDRLNADTVLVETEMNVKLLNKNAETGMAVYRLVRSGSGWKLAAVEMFEVR